MPNLNQSTAYGTAGLVVGILSIIFCFFPVLGFPLSILAVVFYNIQKKRKMTGVATAALVLGIIGIVLNVFVGLFFVAGFLFSINSQFDDLERESQLVMDQIKQQVVDDLRIGNKKMSFPTGNVLLGSGDRKDLVVGIQNLENIPITFALKIYWRDPAGVSGSEYVEMFPDSKLDAVDDGRGIFFWDNTPQTLGLGEARVMALAFSAPATQNTYLYKVEIVLLSETQNQIYDAKKFSVTVS